MVILDFRNAYYRGWFAARARRPTPEPARIEECFFIDMGFADGKFSSGGPLAPWNKSIEPGLAVNLDSELTPDRPVFSTRFRQEPSMALRGESMPARRYADEEEQALAATSGAEAFPTGGADAEQEQRSRRLPEKKPQYKLPGRPAYSSGKRRPVRFAR